MSEQDELLKEEKTASGLEQDLLSPEPRELFDAVAFE